jgi:hypothetical protein
MKRNKFAECEAKGFNKLINFRLPHYCYTTGMVIVGVSIVTMFIRAFAMDGDSEWLKLLLQKILLVGLLLMSIARDKEEDELVVKLRSQSYTYAFIVGVLYTLVMPYVEFGVSNVVNSGGEVYKDLGDFQVLLFMLMIQLMIYHVLKRIR